MIRTLKTTIYLKCLLFVSLYTILQHFIQIATQNYQICRWDVRLEKKLDIRARK